MCMEHAYIHAYINTKLIDTYNLHLWLKLPKTSSVANFVSLVYKISGIWL